MCACSTSGPKRRVFKDAGRVCPIDYHIKSDAFAGKPELKCQTLYVVGGLYGNPFALDAVEKLVAAEPEETLVVLNGDTHWFDKTAENFASLEERMKRYIPLVGNVEAALRRQVDVGVGCGCAYPECTADDSVSRSNRIHKMLSIAVHRHPELQQLLDGRPAIATVDVAGYKVGITHGDEKLIGGWDCSRESLQDVLRQDELDTFMQENDIDVFATTHTCATVALGLARGLVINNGAAGLPNFEGQKYGLVIRISTTEHPDAIIRAKRGSLVVEAVPTRYDHDAYVKWFDDLWDEASPAAISYRGRIVNGPHDFVENALLGEFAPCGNDATGRRAPAQATEHDVQMALAKLVFFEDMLPDESLQKTNGIHTIQANITAQCNLECAHCHVKSNPRRTERMERPVLEAILKVAKDRGIQTIDITGGAPELNPDFEWFLEQAVATVEHVMVRTNLVILQAPKYQHLIEKYAQLGVEVVASLPNVFAAEAEAQRGAGVFDASLEVLKALNTQGYGMGDGLILDLVFNPQSAILPPEQDQLKDMYARRLEALGIRFDNLFAVANNPIGRYGAHLIDTETFDEYLDTLQDTFNDEAAEAMMCRYQMSVGWDGTVYDCDFNQAAGLPQKTGEYAEDEAPVRTIFDYADNPDLSLERTIRFGGHCYACTAGCGSSCGGTLVQGE